MQKSILTQNISNTGKTLYNNVESEVGLNGKQWNKELGGISG